MQTVQNKVQKTYGCTTETFRSTEYGLLVKWRVGTQCETQASLSVLVSKQPEGAEKSVYSLTQRHTHAHRAARTNVYAEILRRAIAYY